MQAPSLLWVPKQGALNACPLRGMPSPEQGASEWLPGKAALPGTRARSAVAQAPRSGLGPCISLHVGLAAWNTLLKVSFPVPVFSPYCKAGLAILYNVRGDVGNHFFSAATQWCHYL